MPLIIDGVNNYVQFDDGSRMTTLLRGYIDGLTMSTPGSSGNMSIAAGQATDSTSQRMMRLASSITKNTGAWTVGTGNGGLDTGVIANNTWYYFYLIFRNDTGAVDVVFSTNSSTPTLPTNYTHFRYIGAGLTNGSGQWTKFTQVGDEFWWDTPVLDVSVAGSTSATLTTVSIPRGRKMCAIVNINLSATGSGSSYLSDPSNSDLAPSNTVSPLNTTGFANTAGVQNGGQFRVWTNTSAQFRRRESSGAGTVYIATVGWIDLRGRDA